ncbi:conserved Plasmodium protein, unknown function [Plasmodium ovale curtisi]|uniref:Uncharacterized protein n=1 Tax=Plasmodium ovale curtisi TaxID=864141 RepID=A0A1A8VP25_PLAOA|nr:conserved Plasmodium protein, unknown function [Plasmodium ovale curtisi]
MNRRKGSAKELFRQMKEELGYMDKREKNSYEDTSADAISEEDDDCRSYYEEIKYLRKDQLKAYICKLRKEIKHYKIKEVNFIIEIKHLRRKIVRLKNVIENDNILKRHPREFSLKRELRDISLRSYENKHNSLQYHFRNSNEMNKLSERSFKENAFTYDNNSLYRSNYTKAKSNKISIRRINDSIHNSRRISEKNNSHSNNTNILNRDRKIIHTIKPIERNYSSRNLFYNRNGDSYNESTFHYGNYQKSANLNIEKRGGSIGGGTTGGITIRGGAIRGNFLSQRSYSSTSKFELKKHLISNSRNIHNMSNRINNTIARDIQNYYSSKQSIQSEKRQSYSQSALLLKRFAYTKENNANDSSRRCNSNNASSALGECKTKTSNFSMKNLKKHYKGDIYDYAHHQKILSKKYTSPYAYKKKGEKGSHNEKKRGAKNVKNGERASVEGGSTEGNILYAEKMLEGKKSKQVKHLKKTQKTTNAEEKRKNLNEDICIPVRSNTGTNWMEENVGKDDHSEACDSGDTINKIKTYMDSQKKKKKNSINNLNEEVTLEKRDNSNRIYGTILKMKEKKKAVNSTGGGINHTASREIHPGGENATKKKNSLGNFKKSIDLDIKEKFQKELEELKRRNNKMISKPRGYCDFSFGSSTGGSSVGCTGRRTGGDKVGGDREDDLKFTRTGRNEMKLQINENPLKDSNVLNVSFNDIDKRISNLQSYLKNTKK